MLEVISDSYLRNELHEKREHRRFGRVASFVSSTKSLVASISSKVGRGASDELGEHWKRAHKADSSAFWSYDDLISKFNGYQHNENAEAGGMPEAPMPDEKYPSMRQVVRNASFRRIGIGL